MPGEGHQWVIILLCVVFLLVTVHSQTNVDTEAKECHRLQVDNDCKMGRPPIYMVVAPRRVRAGQVVQVFITILRMEYGQSRINVRVSIVQGIVELTSSEILFERPSSRILQLLVPENKPEGIYRFRVEGSLEQSATGNIFQNETDIELSAKQASLFIQMSQPIYRMGQKVHFRIIPIQPDLMAKYGTMTVYVDDPNGVTVRRWIGAQTNAGGLVSKDFMFSDQPTFGTWTIRVDAFGHEYRREFIVEEFWMPRFDVNVTVPTYLIENSTYVISGKVLANHTSGRPCKGNATITAFFMPREAVWNKTEGWLKAYNKYRSLGISKDRPDFFPLSAVSPKDYHLFLEYDYRFIDYYDASINFEWSLDEIRTLGHRAGETYSIAGSSVMFFVNVSDWYTSLNQTGWAATTIVDSRVKLQLIGESVRSFKPLSILTVQVAVMRYDGTPVINNRPVSFQVSMSNVVGSAGTMLPPISITPVNGIAEHYIVPHAETQFITFKATYFDGDKEMQNTYNAYSGGQYLNERTSFVEMRANRYYSPSGRYISIRTSTENPKVNEYMIFHVLTSHFVPRLFYQVVAQGNIIVGDELDMTARQKTFAVALSREMVPTARIIVYYIDQPREIISDVLHFFVNGTRQNEVTLRINRGKDFTRDTVEFTALADPGSYVAFSGILHDLYSRGMNDGITENELIDELESYDEAANTTYRHLWRRSDTEYDYKFFSSGDFGIDPNTSFTTSGLTVLTDADLSRIPFLNLCSTGEFRCITSSSADSCHPLQLRCNGRFDACSDGSDEYGCDYHNTTMSKMQPLHYISRVMRYYDNSSWAWQEIFVKPDGRVDFRVHVPKYPLTWMINGISMSRDLGLGIMQRPVRYDATRYMYMQVEHPTVIVRGEQMGVRVTVFNYWFDDDYIEVLVTMHGSDDYEFVIVEAMGYTQAYNPVTHTGDHQTLVFLEPGESKDIYLPIVPRRSLVRGTFTFRVSARCFLVRDDYEGKVDVIPDGVINYYHTPYLVDLIRYGSVDVPDFFIPVEEKFIIYANNRFHNYVIDSPQACISAFGDVVTPGFFEDYLNAENILHRPYGGGEMIAFNFAYNLLTLQFMKSGNQLSNDLLISELDELNIALQRIMSYMNKEDGSFKMFRDDDASSLWLTAFIAETLHWARFGEWERQLFISLELLNKMTLYICSRQNATTGAFIPDDHPAYDYKMASLENNKENLMMTHEIPLTAYVVITLFKLQDVTGEAAHCRDEARRYGIEFLANSFDSIPDSETFHLAITTYALSFGSKIKSTSFSRLMTLMRNSSMGVYFADQVVYDNPTHTVSNIWYIHPRQELMNDAYSVQTTAYALMANIVNSGDELIILSLMQWLNNMRNSIGGMASTQDTITAMNALYQFALYSKNRNIYNLKFTVRSTSTAGWVQNFDFTKAFYSNLTVNCVPSSSTWGAITARVTGPGRAMLQLTTTYNVEYPFLLKRTQRVDINDESDEAETFTFFDLHMMKDLEWHGRNHSVMEMWPCASWVYTDRSLTSGLAVMEVDIPTGYVVMNDTLRDYVRSGVVRNLKRAEFYGHKVVFYFSYLDTSVTCVHFRADRWYPVANATIQHRYRVYDYYEPGMHNTSMYTTYNLFLQNICYVCGSYQCPYCPYFNAATAMKATWTLLLVLMEHFLQRILLRS